jgi:hypothetical protein
MLEQNDVFIAQDAKQVSLVCIHVCVRVRDHMYNIVCVCVSMCVFAPEQNDVFINAKQVSLICIDVCVRVCVCARA